MPEAFDQRYTQYQTQRSVLRRFVRRAYLTSARSQLSGPTLDFGCGVGELLSTLPAGSMGLEYNRATVAHCRQLGLDVGWYDGFEDQWQLSAIPEGKRFESMVVSHVLEHLDAPMDVLGRLLGAARRFGVRRVLVIVPGRAGFRIDPTHRVMVDRAMLESADATAGSGFELEKSRYFPGDLRALGDWFPHHELQAVFRLAE